MRTSCWSLIYLATPRDRSGSMSLAAHGWRRISEAEVQRSRPYRSDNAARQHRPGLPTGAISPFQHGHNFLPKKRHNRDMRRYRTASNNRIAASTCGIRPAAHRYQSHSESLRASDRRHLRYRGIAEGKILSLIAAQQDVLSGVWPNTKCGAHRLSWPAYGLG
jgi:hypothetical protein